MFDYHRHVDDQEDHCFFCQSGLLLSDHYVPAKDVCATQDQPCITVTACKDCQRLVYNYRALKNTLSLQLEFFSTKVVKKKPGRDVSSNLVRISAEEQSLGYEVHGDAVPGTCFYCETPMRGTRDIIPPKQIASRELLYTKYIVPACTQCIGRIKPREFQLTTLKERINLIVRLRASKGQSTKGHVPQHPWQRAMYDDAGVRHVLDIDDILLTNHEREAKNAWVIEQSKLTT
jgi:hypothetical protein